MPNLTKNIIYGVDQLFRNPYYKEYPKEVLIFRFRYDGYLTPDQHNHFFRTVRKQFGKNLYIRSFTAFDTQFREISFWLQTKKSISLLKRIKLKLWKEDPFRYLAERAEEIGHHFTTKFGINIEGSVEIRNIKNH